MAELYNSFDKENHLQPDFDKAEFESLTSWDLGWALLEPINIAADKDSEVDLAKRFSAGQKALYFIWYLDGEVTNGGFIQFYWNNNRRYLAPILEGLKLIGDTEVLKIVEAADKLFIANQHSFELEDTQENFEKLYKELSDFEDLDVSYFEAHDNTMDLLEVYVRKSPSEFVKLT